MPPGGASLKKGGVHWGFTGSFTKGFTPNSNAPAPQLGSGFAPVCILFRTCLYHVSHLFVITAQTASNAESLQTWSNFDVDNVDVDIASLALTCAKEV